MIDPLQHIAQVRNLNTCKTIAVSLEQLVDAVPARLRSKAEWSTLDIYIDQVADTLHRAVVEATQSGVEPE